MFCESCGAKNDDKSQFCENCGASLGYSPPVKGTSTERPGEQGTSKPGLNYAKIGIIFGIFGIFLFFFFFFGLIAIVLGYLGYKKGEEKNGKIAIILGAVGTVLFVLVSLVFI